MLRNIILLLILISGLATGYFIGDYRGKAAREALEKTVKAGQSLDDELHTANATLKAELISVNEKHSKEMERLRTEYSKNSADWQRTRGTLDETIKRQNSRLAELNGALGELIVRLGRTDGAEKVQLEQKIAMLRQDIDALLRELNGNVCLKARVPGKVVETLNGTNQTGSNR
jgi:chromosome segregation ATPase